MSIRKRSWLGAIARGFLVLIGLIAVAVLAVRLLYPLPPLEPREASYRLVDTGDTRLGRGIAELQERQLPEGRGDVSGVHTLLDGEDAFAARVLLARAADRSLDVQYYIWRRDLSGTLLLQALLDAAGRGVRVRMLLDDNGIAGMDEILAALDRHPNIEVRLFNPFVMRSPKVIGYLTDFVRLNRRMHNKSFVADNQAAIIGGRNVGDEYFSATSGPVFADLDVLAIGPVVNDVSEDFDRYWASRSAYPAARILPETERSAPALLRDAEASAGRDAAEAYLAAIGELPFIDQVLAGTLPFEWAPVRMISDDPAKGIGRGKPEGLLLNALVEAVGNPREEVRLVSGYFVPTEAGVDALGAYAEEGASVAVFTNGFAASDVWVVHAGYAPYRRALLEKGVRLFEMRVPPEAEPPERRIGTAGSGSGLGSEGGPVLRSSATTLHAKTFAVDRDRLFIGSFNFDPRSMHLNTELGFLIRSPRLAAAVSDRFDTQIPANAYEVVLDADGSLDWVERRDGRQVVHEEEPGMTDFQRAGVWLLSHLPIEWLL